MPDIPSITKSIRTEQGLTMEAFARALTADIPGVSITRASVNHWEQGVRKPEYTFVLLVFMKYSDWRAGWAQHVLHVLRPNLF